MWVDIKTVSVSDYITFIGNAPKKYILEVVAIEETRFSYRRKYFYKYLNSDISFYLIQHDNLRVFLIKNIDDKYFTLDWLWKGDKT